MQWYEPYFYQTQDSKKQFEGLGLGMAAPLFDTNNAFVGVITVDVSTLKFDEILQKHRKNSQATLTLSQPNGMLIATSTGFSSYLQRDGKRERLFLHDSSSSIVQAIGQSLPEHAEAGSTTIRALGRKHLLVWRTIRLAEGPNLLLTVAVPATSIIGVANFTLSDALYVGWLILTFSVLIVIFVTHWLASPLLSLERWAARISRGRWYAKLPEVGPMFEVVSLAKSLNNMTKRLNSHAVELEHQINLRTEELYRANLQLEKLSMTDDLTGLANRRYFDKQSNWLWKQAQRGHSSFALIVIDIDWFKKYNDHYGHLLGDSVLRRVAQIIGAHARRPSDVAARYGGEEFVLILPDTSADGARLIAEKLLAAIVSEQIEHKGSPYGCVTASIGLATCKKADVKMNLELLFEQADEAMYCAKQKGRNQVSD